MHTRSFVLIAMLSASLGYILAIVQPKPVTKCVQRTAITTLNVSNGLYLIKVKNKSIRGIKKLSPIKPKPRVY